MKEIELPAGYERPPLTELEQMQSELRAFQRRFEQFVRTVERLQILLIVTMILFWFPMLWGIFLGISGLG